MSIPATTPGVAAAAVARKDHSLGASATAKNEPLVFSRDADARSTAGTSEAGQVDGKKPSRPFLERAVIGDLLRIIRDLEADDVPAAKQRLEMMSTADLDRFFVDRKIDPALLGQLKIAIYGRAEAYSALNEVFRVLDLSGASSLSSRLRPAASA
ncbi:hypothetical protein ACSFA3_01230 [Variovorax sp. RHLX14]|uniref:hypothetical protein n=1 Tax=Variovorax sp. RHLX14 TaxID=1259731 RepID=UPI003F46FABB